MSIHASAHIRGFKRKGERTGSALNTYVTLHYSVESHEGKGRGKQVAKDGQGISYKYFRWLKRRKGEQP